MIALNKKALWCIGGLCSLGGIFTASADEVWHSTYGTVTYAEDVGTTAHWTYQHEGKDGIIFIPGLAGVVENRGTYEGYWAQETADTRCDYQRPGLGGEPTFYWGRFHVTFLEPQFPTGWRAMWGYCDADPTESWEGSPVVGDNNTNEQNSSISATKE